MKEEYAAEFCEEGFFHIYNRTNNKELLFLSDEDRIVFMKRYFYYLSAFLETFSWSLLPNHFHFLGRIKSRKLICGHLIRVKPENLKEIERKFLEGEETIEHLIELEWKRFLISYSMRFNKHHDRSGNLFYRSLKRVAVEGNQQLKDVILYIHTNSCKHYVCDDIQNYSWSSYKKLLRPDIHNSIHVEIMSLFNGFENFQLAHTEKVQALINFRSPVALSEL
jgi:putative transposase